MKCYGEVWGDKIQVVINKTIAWGSMEAYGDISG
jgi:hypothetical protein